MTPITLERHPPETAPKGVPVLVAGGVAMRKTGGEWYTGMSDPPFQRPLEWQPKWWAHIPSSNDAPAEYKRPSCNGHERIHEDGSGYICRHCGIDMDDED